MVAPPVALAWWSGAYLVTCFRTLEAPGVPIRYVYQTPGGPLTFYARSYSLSLEHGSLQVTRPQVIDAFGRDILTLDRAEVTGLRTLLGQDKAVKAKLFRLNALLVRLESGKLELERYLPPKTESEGGTPFDLEILGAQVVAIDRTGLRPFRQVFRTNRIAFAGVGDDWVGGGVVRAPGIGNLDLSAQQVKNEGIHLSIAPTKLQLAPLVNYFVTTRDMRKSEARSLHFDSLVTQGPLRVFLPLRRSANAEARLRVVAKNASFQYRQIENLEFEGLLRESGIQGQLRASQGGLVATFRGGGEFGNREPRFAGELTATVPNAGTIPAELARSIPRDLAFRDAAFQGWVDSGTKGDFRARGTVRAAEIRYQSDRVIGAVAKVDAALQGVNLDLQQARYRGQNVVGMAQLGPKSGLLKGAILAKSVPLKLLADRFGVRGLSGSAEINVSVGGTLTKPQVALVGKGNAIYRQNGRRIPLGEFEIDGLWRDQSLTLRRGVLRGPLGLVAASGAVGARQNLGIGVVGRQLRAGSLLPQLGGEANLIATVGGTLAQPKVKGFAEAYNVSYADNLIPAVRTEFAADPKRVALDGIRATSGTADLTGRATLGIESQALKGAFRLKGLQIADVLRGQDNTAGVVDIPVATLGGTLQRPRFSAKLDGESLVVRGAKVDAIEAELSGDRDLITLEKSRVAMAGGTLEATGKYLVSAQLGELTAVAKDLAIDPLARQISSEVTLDGTFGGTVLASASPEGLLSLRGSGDLNRVRLNGTLIGDGPWSVERQGSGFLADIHVGTIDSYIELEKGYFDPYRGGLAGNLWVHNLAASNVVSMADQYLQSLSYDARESVRSIAGNLDVGVALSGTAKTPKIDVDTFMLQNLAYRQVDLGSLSAKLSATGSQISVDDLSLEGPLGRAKLSGTADPDGDISMALDVNNVSLVELGRAVPGVASAGGRLEELSVLLRGKTKSPRVRASAQFEDLLSKPGQPGLSVLLSTIRVSDETGIQVSGNVTYRGFTGDLTAEAPFTYRGGIPDDKELSAELNLPERSLTPAAEYLPSLDRERSQLGNVSGNLSVKGTPNNLRYSGRVGITADRLALVAPASVPIGDPNKATPIRDILEKFEASVGFENGLLQVSSSANSSRKGSFKLSASTPLGQLGRLGESLAEGGSQALLDSPLSGSLDFTEFSLRQPFQGNTYVGAGIDGSIQVRGTLASPLFVTESPLKILGLDTVVPMFEAKPGSGELPAIDPRFDVRFELPAPGRVRTTAAELYLLGDGRISGSLTNPEVRSRLEVESGTLTLPGGRVRLEQGGLVDVSLIPGANGATASAVVDMQGNTSVTALRAGNTYERYNILLVVNGDLLKEGGLNLDASSDPPDLSRDRILALLGQTDLLEAIGQNLGSSDTERRVRDALVGYALPSLADPITNRFARGLGLDYLSIEYNPLEEASVALAKSLGGGFFVQGRRQISDPPPGFSAQYDLRLVYRPRRIRGALNRISFSVGSDNMTPIKLAIEYGVRF